MVRQHLYRIGPDGGHTVAASTSLRESAWLPLLEQQMADCGVCTLPAPAFYQYPLGRGLVISRCAPDPLSENNEHLAHQLIVDEMDDLKKLTRARPLALSHFLSYYLESGSPDMDELLPEALGDETELTDCRETAARLFGGDEELLARFFSAVSLCARDKRQYIRVTIGDTLENVSLFGHQLMELALRSLPMEDSLRVSFCTLMLPDSVNMQYSVCFSPDGGQTLAPAPQEILLNLSARTMIAAPGVELPDYAHMLPTARAVLSGSAEPESGQNGDPSDRQQTPPFEAGMSIRKYFAAWRDRLEACRETLGEDGFSAFAAAEWPKLVGRIITASEKMEPAQFIIEMSSILLSLRGERTAEALELTDDTRTDMIIVLLDSIRWREIDLTEPRLRRALYNACAYSQLLTGDQFPYERLLACRIVHRLITSPASILESLEDMAELEELNAALFEALQHCLRHYVQHRLNADIDVIDEQLAAAAMLGYAKFTDGIPDLRLTDKLTEKIETQIDARSAQQFQRMLDKLRRNLRSSHDGMMIMRRRDMKLFLMISLLLIALIAGISLRFLMLNG